MTEGWLVAKEYATREEAAFNAKGPSGTRWIGHRIKRHIAAMNPTG
jgi:hypothetical protein